MKPGDKVRFLNQTGGGIVVGFDKRGLALVEDEDGFRIPMPQKECVVVEENIVGKSKSGAVRIPGKITRGRGGDIPDIDDPCENKPVAENIYGAEGISSGTRFIQTVSGEDLDIALIYTGRDGRYSAATGKYCINQGSGNSQGTQVFNCTLVNESNYNLLVTYTVIYKGKHTTVFAGEILPYERNIIFTFSKEALAQGAKKVQVRAIPFKRTGSGGIIPQGCFNFYKGIHETGAWEPKDTVVKEFMLDPVNLLKESMFKENEYLPERGYVVNIIKEGRNNPDKFTELQKELADKFRKDIKETCTANKTKSVKESEDSVIKITASGIMEVDLHAHELLETTSGMSSTDILLYQLGKFNEVMKSCLNKKGTRIVFIHGKGDGVLRNALLKELKARYSRCTWQDASFKEYGFGATMVTI